MEANFIKSETLGDPKNSKDEKVKTKKDLRKTGIRNIWK